MLDHGARVPHPLLGALIAVVVGAGGGAIHAYSPHESALAFLLADGSEEVGGCGVDGGVVCGGGCAVGEGGGDGAGVDAAGVGEGGEAGFEGEGVGLEPGEEGGGAEEAGIGELGGVGVGVCFGDFLVSMRRGLVGKG